jgi:two-component system, NarL family, nitrate/nitrite response regulator NarL
MALRCLIVDDSPHFLAAARPLLEQGGVEVVGAASNPAEALQAVEALKPQVVLIDIDLGEHSGLELVRRLSSVDTASLILISTHAEADFKDLIASSPAIGFIHKSQLSARAIRDLLGDEPAGAASGPPDT